MCKCGFRLSWKAGRVQFSICDARWLAVSIAAVTFLRWVVMPELFVQKTSELKAYCATPPTLRQNQPPPKTTSRPLVTEAPWFEPTWTVRGLLVECRLGRQFPISANCRFLTSTQNSPQRAGCGSGVANSRPKSSSTVRRWNTSTKLRQSAPAGRHSAWHSSGIAATNRGCRAGICIASANLAWVQPHFLKTE